jgi:hypothetical protein
VYKLCTSGADCAKTLRFVKKMGAQKKPLCTGQGGFQNTGKNQADSP